MRFVPGHHAALDRVGGVPTHLPPTFPVSASGRPLRFLAQFYCDGARLRLDNTLCLHVYEDEAGYDPTPVVVRVPLAATLNVGQLGTPAADIAPHDIQGEYREDPDEAADDQVELAASKVGGVCYFPHALGPGERLLLFFKGAPGRFQLWLWGTDPGNKPGRGDQHRRGVTAPKNPR
jgi:hypothetical protein